MAVDWVTSQQAAEILGITSSGVLNLETRGFLAAINRDPVTKLLTGSVRYRLQEVETLAAHRKHHEAAIKERAAAAELRRREKVALKAQKALPLAPTAVNGTHPQSDVMDALAGLRACTEDITQRLATMAGVVGAIASRVDKLTKELG